MTRTNWSFVQKMVYLEKIFKVFLFEIKLLCHSTGAKLVGRPRNVDEREMKIRNSKFVKAPHTK